MNGQYQYKNKWNSTRISKQFKNRHRRDRGNADYDTISKPNAHLYIDEVYEDVYYNNESINDIYSKNQIIPSWSCNRCTYFNIERNSHCSICQLSFNCNMNMNNDNESQCVEIANDENTDILMGEYLEPLLNEIEMKNDDFDEQIQIAINLSLQDITCSDSEDTDDSSSVISSNTSNTSSTYSSSSSIINRKTRRIKTRGSSFAKYWRDMTEYKTLFEKNLKFIIQQNKLRLEQEGKITEAPSIWPGHGKIRQESYKMITAHVQLMKKIPTIDEIHSWLRYYYDGKDMKVRNIINPQVLAKFIKHGTLNKGDLEIVYHGTRATVAHSIVQRGLIVGGTKGVPISTGAIHGNGVYCSPSLSTAYGYERGALFICLVRQSKCKQRGSIYVVPNDDDILPCYLAEFSYSGDLPANNVIFKFQPGFVPLNRDPIFQRNRRTRRKWSNYHKLQN